MQAAETYVSIISIVYCHLQDSFHTAMTIVIGKRFAAL
jgi:hypothetical protein